MTGATTRWCPSCRAEYKPYVTECPDCVVGLVDELPATLQPYELSEDHSLAEWDLHDWDEAELRDLLVMLRTHEIHHEWNREEQVLRANHLDEADIDGLLALFEDDAPLPEPDDVEATTEDVGDRIAGPGRRIGGFVIDQFLLTTASAVVFRAFFFNEADTRWHYPRWSYLAIVGGTLAYRFVTIAVWGRTMGKQVAGTIVVDSESGAGVSGGQALLRATAELVAFVPFVGLIGLLVVYVPALFDGERRGLHDRLARTVVMRR